jgi:hypothetical protein
MAAVRKTEADRMRDLAAADQRNADRLRDLNPSWKRDLNPSLPRMCLTCTSPVPLLITSRSAIGVGAPRQREKTSETLSRIASVQIPSDTRDERQTPPVD